MDNADLVSILASLRLLPQSGRKPVCRGPCAETSGPGTSTRHQRADAAGNTTTSSPVDIVVANAVPDGAPPTVSLTAPAAGTVTNTVTITASAADNVGVTKVEFLVDGVVIATDTSAPYSASWNTNTSALGGHSVTAKAYDAANNSATSAARSVTVVDSTRPTVSVTNPANNALVNRNSNVTITASAS